MRKFYETLSEKDRRRYAAIEAKKLGHGGISYVCRVLQCNARTVQRGMQELAEGLLGDKHRIRQAGGGRKSMLATTPGLEEAFLQVIDNHTAGSPMDEKVKWTNLSRSELAHRLEGEGFKVSVTIVDQLLEKHNFHRRQAFKSVSGKEVPHRDKQFKKIEELKQEYHEQGNPVMSMDVKKKR